MSQGSLTIVGTGITAIRHVSLETHSYLKDSSKVLYLVTEPVTEEWILDLNSTAENLLHFYEPGRNRLITYTMITERILECVRQGHDTCVAFYGHPGVFVYPSHESVLRARREGYTARILPAISSEDCLFADLGVDPGRVGCQSYEATDYLVHNRLTDTSCALILWQIGVVGESENKPCRPENIQILTDALLEHYPPTHEVIVYEASQYTICDPVIITVELANLPDAQISPISTLFVPAARPLQTNEEMVTRLDIRRYTESPSIYNPLKPEPLTIRA